MGQRTNAFKIIIEETSSKAYRRRENTIRTGLKYIGLIMGNWIDSAQDRDY